MTAGSTQRPERLTRDNALLLLVDHQVGLYTGIRDIDVLQLKHNIVGLTRAMLALKVPMCYSNVAVEILADNAAPEAEAVYGALGMPFSTLVFGLKQYYSQP